MANTNTIRMVTIDIPLMANTNILHIANIETSKFANTDIYSLKHIDTPQMANRQKPQWQTHTHLSKNRQAQMANTEYLKWQAPQMANRHLNW